MIDFKRVRPLDAAIVVVGLLVLGLGIYLGTSVWLANRAEVKATPASRAIDTLIANVRSNPNDYESRMKLAQAFSMAGRDREAVEQYNVILKANKDFIPAISGLGFMALQQKQWAVGESYFRRAVELMEGTPEGPGRAQLETAYFYLGTALMEQKKYEDAVGFYKAALRIRRDASDTHYSLAVTYRELGEKDGYKEELRAALIFDPTMPEANYDMGNILLAEGDIAGAAEHFRVSANAAPNVSKPRVALAKLGSASEHLAKAKLSEKSNPKLSLTEARIAAALDPKSVETGLLVARLYEKAGQRDKAAAAFEAVVEMEPGNTEATAGLKRTKSGS